ncbi:acyltransferase [Actinomycetospora endophytica]|uniref:Acyltransferase n=1 Tax=Actinomycetospora endophytica TaxID=2291215 RepID=A0ABS8P2B1_9PSEU|nr:acyltransferase [Actinomycetospora endophytica]MCD2192363.1 acyltransferase [Actinomycetospora endophytica]
MTSTPTPSSTTSGAAKPAGSGLIASLVGIRGILALVVVAVHLAPFASAMMPVTTPAWNAVWHHGYVALDMFFVLSGFVISSGYRKVFARWPGRAVFGKFLWARLSRFYPIHLAVLAVMVAAVLVSRAVGHEIPHGGNLGWDLIRQITLTSGWGGAHALTWNGPVWSLSAEWACYLVFPILVPLVLRLRTPRACVLGYLVACAIPLVAYSFIGFDDASITYEMPLPRAFGAFLAGASLCQLTHVGSRIPAWIGRVTGPLVVLSLAAITVLAVFGHPSMLSLPVVGLIVLALAQQRGAVNTFLSTRWALVGGEYSVALFLVHVPWILASSLVINPRTFPGAWGIVGTLLIALGSFVLAWVAYQVIEKPAQRWMRTLVKRPAKAPARSLDERTDRVVTGRSTGT